MELFGFASNPIPEGAVAGTILARDGVRLRFARWPAVAQPGRGTVCLLQGRAEQIEKYFEVVGDLRRRGFAVATFDWRGQGGSERRLANARKGHVGSFAEFDRDLDAFMEQVALADCPPPHYGLAHSTGALVCLRGVRDGRVRFSRMVLVSALLALGPLPLSQPLICRASAVLTAIGLGERDVPGSSSAAAIESAPFDGNFLTSDVARYARSIEIVKNAPSVGISAPTIGWLNAACRAMRKASRPEFAAAVGVPALMVAGSLDQVVSPQAIEKLAGRLRIGGQVVIAGARHELMMERDSLRDQFWAAFDAFVPGSPD